MRTFDEITNDLVAATRDLQDVRAERERAVALLCDRDRVLETARARVTNLREELLTLVDRQARARRVS